MTLEEVAPPNKLKYFRTQQFLTQKELTEKTKRIKKPEVNQVTISFIENRYSKPAWITMWVISKALRIPIEEIFPWILDEKTTGNLRYFRTQKLMTQKELAKASGVSQVAISFIEDGYTQNPTEKIKKALAKALKVSMEKLFPPEESPTKVAKKQTV